MRRIIAFFLLSFPLHVVAQHYEGKSMFRSKEKAVTRISGDERVSCFSIEVKDSVPSHYHKTHSEHVLVISGIAWMKLGEERFRIRKGDVIFIPAMTCHSVRVIGRKALKVVSIQAPAFDGSDRHPCLVTD